MRERPPHQKVSFHSKHSNHNTHRCFYIDGICQFAVFVDSETDIKAILDGFLREKDFVSLKEYRAPEWDHIGFVDYFPETNEIFLTTDKKTKNIILQDVSTASIGKERKQRLQEERKIKEEQEEKERLEKEAQQKLIQEEKDRKRSEKMLRKAAKEQKIAKKKSTVDLNEEVETVLQKEIREEKEKLDKEANEKDEEPDWAKGVYYCPYIPLDKKLADLEEGVSVAAGSEKSLDRLNDDIFLEGSKVTKNRPHTLETPEKIVEKKVSKSSIRSLI